MMGHLPLLALGPLTATEVSEYLCAVDVYLLPITDGVSTRRTSLMCALQHQLPIVATSGVDTDLILQEHNEHAFQLVPEEEVHAFAAMVVRLIRNPGMRTALSEHGRDLFLQEFSWERISAKFLETLNSFATHAH